MYQLSDFDTWFLQQMPILAQQKKQQKLSFNLNSSCMSRRPTVCLMYMMDIYLFLFSLAEEENLHVAMVTHASGEEKRFTVSTDGVWEQAVVPGLVFLARSDCDLFKGTV